MYKYLEFLITELSKRKKEDSLDHIDDFLPWQKFLKRNVKLLIKNHNSFFNVQFIKIYFESPLLCGFLLFYTLMFECLPQARKNSHTQASLQWLFITHLYALISLLSRILLDDSSNTTVNITTCIALSIFFDVLFHKMIHFVIITSISETFQVQNKPMGFLPPS